jgi:general stress protein 26
VKKTTAEHDPQANARLHQMVREIAVAMVTTVTPDGALHSRPMITLDFAEDGDLWFMMSDASEKARDLAEEEGVNVSYADHAHDLYVSVSGNARIVRDQEKLHDFWNKALSKYFPGGQDDPHLVLLRVAVETAEYWDSESGGMRSVTKSESGDDAGTDGKHVRVDIRATPSSG